MAHQSDGQALSLGRLGMGTEQCAVVVISKSWMSRSMFLPISLSIIAYEQSKHRERRRGNSVRRPIRGDAADGRHHCRCYLRSLEYCWLRNQPATWRPTHNEVLLLCSETVGLGLKMQASMGHRLTACTFPTQHRTPSTTRGLQPSCLDTYNLRRSFVCPGDPVS